ncbi:amino acid ABC transporter substrate-binding protein [Fusobacterium pseudoperiodonticum]|uniref:Amino acid ABC transporter substrate-binding protein n=1 Tax=Fusobacterium pseudoperiodonticum TaxID=2663009 RepID=A0A2D3PIF6_9FUSO|nr:cysteine ABC transporter substrate-binding protein [Fusobacterium pseudoperiodonticum]ATV63582.1 amino acid ABC transporter substrate-binding protein [Fusobacterium pseudoperiodonticum]ATV66037.1 amino acid ABC transporter substrate-binding protein [Fusobacterium pseudoperiodonticum]ATV67449.1 amino acid ABC transporter substrate-binding protein [Fusobacterium pseudoperiodonticum]ATV71866.1 amino acid ABC transporter substrate-binding protein [Fusobacterium pseudoperiodonticum]
MKIWKKILKLATVGVAVFALAACGNKTEEKTEAQAPTQEASVVKARTVQEIKDSGVIRIGVFTDKAPFGYIDENGKNQGYDVYFTDRLAKDLGVQVEYISLDPASRVEYAETGKVDIVAANFTVTPERAEKVDFSLPYMKVSLGVVSPDGAVIKSVEELKDKTLIVSKGTTAEYYFSKNHPEVKLQKYDSYADAYNALLDGRGDAFSTDNTEVLAWAKSNPGFTVGIESLGDVDTIAVAVQKGNTDLLDWINNEIKELGKENFFHEAYKATLEPIYGDSADPDSIVVEGGEVK